jgi:hypothetical protein
MSEETPSPQKLLMTAMPCHVLRRQQKGRRRRSLLEPLQLIHGCPSWIQIQHI